MAFLKYFCKINKGLITIVVLLKPLKIYLLFCLFLPLFAVAQQSPVDSSWYPEEEFSGFLIDSLSDSPDYVPEDMIFIPSDVLYNNSWDNVNVRVKRQDLSTLEDTTFLYLSHPSENKFVFPYKGKFLSPYGFRGRRIHAGVDIKCTHGDSMYCAFDGKVRLAKRYRGYGNLVVVRHYNGLETVYGHLSKILVHINDDVKAGQVLGLGGRTGRATTDHLHFETRFLGEPFNPNTFIDFENYCLKSDTVLISASLFSYAAKMRHPKKGKGASASADNSDSGTVYYKVRKGDTLAKIAKKHRTTVVALCQTNKISKKTPLKVGKRLKIN